MVCGVGVSKENAVSGRLARWVVESNLWVALAAAALVLFVDTALGVPAPPSAVILVGAATLLIYRFDAWVGGDRPAPGRWLVLIAAALAAVSLWRAPTAVRWFVGVGAVPCLLYGVRLPLPRAGTYTWRALPGVKPGFVTLAVAAGVIGVPVLWEAVPPVGASLSTLTVSLLLLLLCNVTLFDLRDLDHDARQGVRTLPVRLGPHRARRLVGVLGALAVVIAGGSAAAGLVAPWVAGSLGIAGGVTAWFSLCQASRASPLQYALAVDGIPVLLGVSALLT